MNIKPAKKRSLTPRLRFPEFREAGEWEEKRLGKLFSERQENKFPSLPLLSLTEQDGVIPQEQSNRKNNANGDKSKYLRVVPGDIVYNTMRMWEGRSALVGLEGIVSPAYTVCTPASGNSGLFFSYYFKTQKLIKQFYRYSQGLVSDTLNLKFQAFAKITVLLPHSLREQQKVADCLSSLDKRISVETHKLETLKAHKKGLLAQLFPAEGETAPLLRFPGFQDAGEWEVDLLGELLLAQPDYGVNAPAVPYSPTLPTYLRITDISDNGCFITDKKASVDVIVTHINCLSEGEIVLARTGASTGKAYKYKKEDGELVFAGFLIRIRPDCKKVNSDFLFNFLFTKLYWKWVEITSPRSGQPGINSGEYAMLPVPLPPCIGTDGLLEQQKIADCLSSLDELITAQTQKIDLFKAHKKGLMQQLFPDFDEVRA